MNKAEVLREVKRKSIHVIPGFAAIPIIVWTGKPVALAISLFFLTLYTLHEISLRKNLNLRVPIAADTFKIMAREEELKKRYFTGTIYFWLSATLLILFLEPVDAAAAIMISSFGDAVAAIVGKAIPYPRLLYSRTKSLAGLVAMFAVSLLSCLVAGVDMWSALIVSATSSIVESITWVSVLDELTVPLSAGLLLWILP